MRALRNLAAALVCVVLTGPAFADPIIGLMLAETGFGTATFTSPFNPLIVNQAYGTFSLNTEVVAAFDNPASINLNSTNVSTSAGGTLVITASATNLLAPNGFVNFLSQLTGLVTIGEGVTVSLDTFLDNSNTLFGMGTPLSVGSLSQSPLVGFPFATSDFPGFLAFATAPFALTEVLTITTTGSAILLANGSVIGSCPPGTPGCSTNPPADVPEPSSVFLMGSALIGLGVACWYRRRRQDSAGFAAV